MDHKKNVDTSQHITSYVLWKYGKNTISTSIIILCLNVFSLLHCGWLLLSVEWISFYWWKFEFYSTYRHIYQYENFNQKKSNSFQVYITKLLGYICSINVFKLDNFLCVNIHRFRSVAGAPFSSTICIHNGLTGCDVTC